MRTLKRSLALVLALVMVLGFGAFASAAEITDADEVKYTEAVDALYGIGVFTGYPDGSFGPKNTLIRAEAAVMIARLLGADDLAGKAPFSDLEGYEWAESAIAYCAAKGIVEGYDGKFDPAGQLTASAWLKMLCVALGYDAKTYGMTGDTWEIGVAGVVKTLKLTTGNAGVDQTLACTREEAALYALNALDYSATVNYGYRVFNVDPTVEPVYYDTLVEAAAAVTVLGSGWDYDTAKTQLPSENLGTKTHNLLKRNVTEGLGLAGYYRYVDVNDDGSYTATVDTLVTDFVCTDTVVGTFTAANTIKEAVAAAGKTATQSLTVDLYMNGAAWASDVSWAGNNTAKLITDTSCTMTLVKTAAGDYKALYEYTGLYKATKGGKDTTPTSVNYGKYAYTFALQNSPATAFVSEVPSSVTVYAVDGTYTHNGMYNVVTDGTKLLSCAAATGIAIKATATAATYVKVGTTQYNLASAQVNIGGVLGANKVVYLNAAGDAILFTAPGAAAATVYEGYVYMLDGEYVATAGTEASMLAESKAATVTAKAKVVNTAGETVVVDLATKIVPATAVASSKAQLWTGAAYEDLTPAATATALPTLVENEWYAYTKDEAGAYKLVLVSGLDEALTYGADKATSVTVGSTVHYLTSTTVLNVVNYDGTAKALTTTTKTGYANFTQTLLNGKNAIVVADPTTKVVSSITIYTETAVVAPTAYAVYAGLGENVDTVGQYYNFYVGGELKSYLTADVAPSTTVADIIAGLTAGDVVSYELTAGKLSDVTDLGAGTTKTVALVGDGYVVFTDSTTPVAVATTGMVAVDKTATIPTYAVIELAVGDTVEYYVNGSSAIEFAVVKTHVA